MLEIEDSISNYYEIYPYRQYKHCWRSDLGDLGGEFITTIFKILHSGEICVALIAADFFDEKLCNAIIDLIEDGQEKIGDETVPLQIVNGLSVEGYPFDSLAITNYESFRMFHEVDEALDKRTFGAIPIARCELTGHETPEELLGIFVRLIKDVEWGREIAPRTLMRYKLPIGGARKFKLYEQDSLRLVLHSLSDEDKYNIEIYNFKDEYVQIVQKEGVYKASGDNKVVIFESSSFSDLERWIGDYLVYGFE